MSVTNTTMTYVTRESTTTEESLLHDVFHHASAEDEHKSLVDTINYAMLVVMPLGLLGNTLSLMVWLRRKLRKSRIAKYMCLLALADNLALISGFLCRVLPTIWGIDLRQTNPFWCHSIYFFLGFFACSSAWTLIVVTLERFVVILSPISSATCLSRCKAPSLVIFVVILSGSVNSVLIIISAWSDDAQCTIEQSWADIAKLMIFILYSPLPVLILLVLNTAIIIRMNRFKAQIERSSGSLTSGIRVGHHSASRKFSQTSTSNNSVHSRKQSGGIENKTCADTANCADSTTGTTQEVAADNPSQPGAASSSNHIYQHNVESVGSRSTAMRSVVVMRQRTPASSRRCSQLVELKRLSTKETDLNSGPQSSINTTTSRISHVSKTRSADSILNCDNARPSLLLRQRNSVNSLLEQLRDKSEKLAEKYAKLKKRKSTIMLLTVTTSYFILTTPYSLCTFILIGQAFTGSDTDMGLDTEKLYLAQHSLELLLCINHSVNILLYCAAGSKFRREMKEMFTFKNHSLLYSVGVTDSIS